MKPHPIFTPLSWIYAVVVWIRNRLFDRGVLTASEAGVPVISIGNITAGGSGKTPVVIAIGKFLLGEGKKAAIVSRGYGRKTTGSVVVSDGLSIVSDAENGGDEPMQIAAALPNGIVIVDEDRVRGARRAVKEFGAEVIILDDGFQHRQLARSLDIVVMDAHRLPFTTGLLPAGYRREPLSELRRAQCVIVTKVQNVDEAAALMNNTFVTGMQYAFSSAYVPVALKDLVTGAERPLDELPGRSILAVSGIADPESFYRTIASIDGHVTESVAFQDHHRYNDQDVASILSTMKKIKAEIILTTEKDAVKLTAFAGALSGIPMYALAMSVQFHRQAEFEDLILRIAQ
jgi:tetraacyldisaccharide 4'-kinase